MKTEPLLAVADAQEAILRRVRPLPPKPTPLAESLGRVLAEDVASDLDMPPFDKAMMDGYAVRAADLSTGKSVLTVIEEVTAGRTPDLPVGPGQATRIMTGAPVPEGADTVLQAEAAEEEGGKVRVTDAVPPGRHVGRRE